MRLRDAELALVLAPPVALTGGVAPAAVTVRYAEGTLHGFLELRNTADSLLAHGDLLQVPRDEGVETRLVFQFTDSSSFKETVRFTQHGVFRLERYQLEQRGHAFEQDLSVELAGDR